METQISLFDAEKVQRQEAEMEKAFQEWSRLPDEVQIPADDPIRPKVASMLRRGYGIIYGQALHRCPGLPAGKYIWLNYIERPEYWVMNDEGNPSGQHIEFCPFCGAYLKTSGGDVLLVKADGGWWAINRFLKGDGRDI